MNPHRDHDPGIETRANDTSFTSQQHERRRETHSGESHPESSMSDSGADSPGDDSRGGVDDSSGEGPTRTEFGGLYGTERPTAEQRAAVTQGQVPVAVYGLGKMGLPLAAVFARVTGNTIGVDVDQRVVDTINAGRCHVEREPGLAAMIDRTVSDASLVAVTNGERAARRARVHVIIVPTLVDESGSPDLSTLRAATETVAAGLEPGDMVCIESTVPPTTCEEVVEPLLITESDCEPGSFGLAFCPERTASGRALRDIGGAYPKVVGGIDDESTRVANLLYDIVTENEVIPTSDPTTAEAVKVFEGVYRDVNIALANELATYADELAIDVREAIQTANTQPFCDLHEPGPGVGGHCIPYYPYFLIEGLDTASPLLSMAREVNDSMPAYTAREVIEGLHRADVSPGDAVVGILGIAYRPGVQETRESPGLAIADLLETVGITVRAADPVVDVTDHGLEPLDAIDGNALDAVVMVTDHEEFETIPWQRLDQLVIVDGRDAVDVPESEPHISTIGNGTDSN
jgi:UDP-N-acetyl-D-mannosaminuronic acid dehydrogenase